MKWEKKRWGVCPMVVLVGHKRMLSDRENGKHGQNKKGETDKDTPDVSPH